MKREPALWIVSCAGGFSNAASRFGYGKDVAGNHREGRPGARINRVEK